MLISKSKPKIMNEQISFYEQKLKYEIDPWDLRNALTKGEKVIVVDARSKDSYEEEHIPGAINLHHRLMSPDTTSYLDMDQLIVVYCSGIGCNASTKGALNLTKLGFKVKELIGGLEWWKRDGYETEGLGATVSKEHQVQL